MSSYVRDSLKRIPLVLPRTSHTVPITKVEE
jgi:hypothetical protein